MLEKGIKSEILQTKKFKTAWMPETLLAFLFPKYIFVNAHEFPKRYSMKGIKKGFFISYRSNELFSCCSHQFKVKVVHLFDFGSGDSCHSSICLQCQAIHEMCINMISNIE